MPDILQDYRDALVRLRRGKSENVPKGTKITNDSVSLEAGRKKGTIKRSRPIFKDLIDEINAAAAEQSKPEDAQKARIDELKAEVAKYRTLWDERQEWSKKEAALTGEKVVAINGRRMTKK